MFPNEVLVNLLLKKWGRLLLFEMWIYPTIVVCFEFSKFLQYVIRLFVGIILLFFYIKSIFNIKISLNIHIYLSSTTVPHLPSKYIMPKIFLTTIPDWSWFYIDLKISIELVFVSRGRLLLATHGSCFLGANFVIDSADTISSLERSEKDWIPCRWQSIFQNFHNLHARYVRKNEHQTSALKL